MTQLASALPSMRLDGRVALVTGAGRGIGRAIALCLAEQGAEVVAVSRTSEEIDEVAKAINGTGARARSITCDVADPEQIKSLMMEVKEGLGGLDILVNNAGGAHKLSGVEDVDARSFDKAIALNLSAVQATMREAAPLLFDRPGRASVINVTSIAASTGLEKMSFYSAAKAGVVGLSRAAAREWGERGVRVNCVAPGWIETGLSSGLRGNDEFFNSTIRRIPLRRWGAPEEIAAAVAFLAGDAASYVTGTTLLVDGGILA